jgi:hypothetical protein
MKATRFEYRHQTLLHLLLVGLAVATYLRNPDDIVWAVVRGHSDSALLERLVFGAGALMLLASAVLETWANAYNARLPKRLARIFLALGVGQLLPLPGLMVLLAGEAMLIFRLYLRDRASADISPPATGRPWGPAFRSAASRWGLALSMMVFVWTLQDRIAEAGAAISLVVWVVLNFRRGRPAVSS